MALEDIMSRKFSFPSAKEALALSQKKVEKKSKRLLTDTSVVDERPVVKLSMAGDFC